MKTKLLKNIILVSCIVFASSCEKALDEVYPRASLSPEIVGAAEAPKLLNGIYDALQTGNTSFYYLSYAIEDLSADNLVYRATFFQHGEINDNAILTANVLVSRFFNGPYAIIQRVNDLVEILNANTSIPDNVKKPLLTQAYFLRAYAYYRLVTIFGPVPIVNDRAIVKVPRKSVDEVYAKIIDDLGLSITNGGEFTDSKFASALAAKALLARVYLIRKNYPLAKLNADEVINSGKFSLSTNYAASFAAPYNSSEQIFKLNFTTTEGEQSLDFFLQHPDMPGSGRAELPVDMSLVNAYEPNDTRKAASITFVAPPAANSNWYCKKYQDPTGNGALPFNILRVSEMYLISSEAQFLGAGNSNPLDVTALGLINEVRTKRGLTGLLTLSLAAIAQERRVELAFEGTRWMDMKRLPSTSNPAKSVATVFLEAKGRTVNDELYPIPQAAINTNDLLLPNNPGYN